MRVKIDQNGITEVKKTMASIDINERLIFNFYEKNDKG